LKEGALQRQKEKSLIASRFACGKCPYCIDALYQRRLTKGITKEENDEAVHVGPGD